MSEKPDPPKDVLLVAGPGPDGGATRVVRQREGRVELGLLRPVVSGQALTGELVRLTQRPESPALFDVHVEATAPLAARPPQRDEAPSGAGDASEAASRVGAGPARVSSPTFRAGWDAIWGAKPAGQKRLLN